MKTTLKIIFLTVFITLTACEPRGESKSLDEVFDSAHTSFKDMLDNNAPKEVKDQLAQLGTLLEKLPTLASSDELAKQSNAAAEQLEHLITSAGYTSRPGMGELIGQYRTIAEDAKKLSDNKDLSAMKLLVARSYNLLTSELEGVKFNLKDREHKQ